MMQSIRLHSFSKDSLPHKFLFLCMALTISVSSFGAFVPDEMLVREDLRLSPLAHALLRSAEITQQAIDKGRSDQEKEIDQAQKDANTLVTNILKTRFPTLSAHLQESDFIKQEGAEKIIGDTLDFKKLPSLGMDHYCSVLGIVTGDAFLEAIGVTYIPKDKEMIWTDQNGVYQAFRKDDGTFTAAKKCQVRSVKDLTDQLIYTEPADDIDGWGQALTQGTKKGAFMGRNHDSAAWHLIQVAIGAAAGYFERSVPLNDAIVGMAAVHRAGGKVNYTLNNDGTINIVATSKDIYDQILALHPTVLDVK